MFVGPFDINKAAQNIAVAWNEEQSKDMNGLWRKLCAQVVNDFKEFDIVGMKWICRGGGVFHRFI